MDAIRQITYKRLIQIIQQPGFQILVPIATLQTAGHLPHSIMTEDSFLYIPESIRLNGILVPIAIMFLPVLHYLPALAAMNIIKQI
jgi:hypothetical protein